MRVLTTLALAGAFTVVSLQAADDVSVFKAQLTGPTGVTDGKMVVVGDRIVFVDDERPQLSFSVAKNDVKKLTFEQGALTVDLGRPFTDRFGSRTNLVLKTEDPKHIQTIATWSAVPLVGEISMPRTDESSATMTTSSSTSTAGQAGAAAGMQSSQTQGGQGLQTLTFDARHDHAVGNCYGKLIVREDGLAFESVGEAGHSRSWKYSEIEELERNRSENKVIIDPYTSDDDFTLKLTGNMDEAVFRIITDRIVAARPKK